MSNVLAALKAEVKREKEMEEIRKGPYRYLCKKLCPCLCTLLFVSGFIIMMALGSFCFKHDEDWCPKRNGEIALISVGLL